MFEFVAIVDRSCGLVSSLQAVTTAAGFSWESVLAQVVRAESYSIRNDGMLKPIFTLTVVFVVGTTLVCLSQDRGKISPADPKRSNTEAVPPDKTSGKAAVDTPVLTKPPLSPEDQAAEQAIREAASLLIEDFNAKKAEAFASRFLPNAEYEFENNEVLTGREAIKNHFAHVFENFPEAKATYKETRIRLVTPQLAVEEGLFEVRQLAASDETEEQVVITWAATGSRWQVSSMREIASIPIGGIAHDRLEQLSWLIGDWVDESHASVVKTVCHWSNDGNYLLREFEVRVRGEKVLSTTQRIGWDPQAKQIRAWFFDSNGGFGESFWTWDGDQWVIRVSSVREDGAIASSLDFLDPMTSDSHRWLSTHRMVADDRLPDLNVVIVRQSPHPPKPAEVDTKSAAVDLKRDN